MLDRPTNPLEIARKILKPETIVEIRQRGFNNPSYLILDRWALNSPDELKALEEEGLLDLLIRLDQQDTIENRILTSDSAWEAKQQGMSDWEILAMHGVDTELRTTE